MAIAVSQLLAYPLIAGRISRIAPLAPYMSNMFGVNLGTIGSGKDARITTGATKRSLKRSFVYDIFDNARDLVEYRAPGTGPAVATRKPYDTVSMAGLRSYTMLPFKYEDLRDFRIPGSNSIDVVDDAAGNYIANQADRLIQRCMNTREFAFVRMLKGSMNLKIVGNGFKPVLSGGEVTVDWKLPAGHKDQLAIGGSDGATDIISASWGTSSTDILTQLHELRSVSATLTGYEPRCIFMNSILFSKLQNNTKLQSVGGSVFRVFETFSRREVGSPSTTDPKAPAATPGYYYQFRGLPQMDVYVYDGVFDLDPSAATSPTSRPKFIGDNEVIITPGLNQKDWFEVWDVMEMVQEQYDTQVQEVYGFHAWMRRELKETPSVEMHTLDNYAYALTIPKAIFNPTVVF